MADDWRGMDLLEQDFQAIRQGGLQDIHTLRFSGKRAKL
jgi:hypothetical protein